MGSREASLKVRVLLGLLRELDRLMVLTPGLVAIAAERVGEGLASGAGGPADHVQACRDLLKALEVEADVRQGETIDIAVQAPCPYSFATACERSCVLPHLLSSFLSSHQGEKWVPVRVDGGFVQKNGGACLFRLAKARTRPPVS